MAAWADRRADLDIVIFGSFASGGHLDILQRIIGRLHRLGYTSSRLVDIPLQAVDAKDRDRAIREASLRSAKAADLGVFVLFAPSEDVPEPNTITHMELQARFERTAAGFPASSPRNTLVVAQQEAQVRAVLKGAVGVECQIPEHPFMDEDALQKTVQGFVLGYG